MNQRFYSLDVFRGATVALMILVNNPGSWGHIYDPLKHAYWHGCTPTDLVFPFFLFAVGNAMAFVLPKLEAAGPAVFWKKVLKRTFLIFFIGLLLNLFPFVLYNAEGELALKKLENLRIMGVLQRIAICYFVASVMLYYLKAKGAFIASAFILFAYWFVCIATNTSDPFSLAGWFGTNIDISLFGKQHLYKGEGIPFDPEGLMSSFAAIVQVVFGYMAGHYILSKGKTAEMLNGLFVAGTLLVFTGFVWDMQFPINKKIWTSSYTVYTTGLALLVLSMMIYVIEFRQVRGAWSKFFDVFGKNALFIFVLSGALPRLLALIRIPNGVSDSGKSKFLTPFNWVYEKICKPIFEEPRNGSLLYALLFICLMWLIAWWMDKKKIYIKV